MEDNATKINIIKSDRNDFQMEIEGRLDIDTTAKLWNNCLKIQEINKPKKLTLDASKISYCDGAGIGLILELQNRQQQEQQEFSIKNLASSIQNLLELSEHPTYKVPKQDEKHLRFAERIGVIAVNVLANIKENITFIGMFSYQALLSLRYPGSIRWRDFFRIINDVGPDALPLIALIGFLVGLITAFQSAVPLERFGAEVYIINLAAIGLPREMGPLMAAIILAGRTASAFAAELGTMAINQEVDALTTMGLEPVRFLAIPRILATALMTPFLNLFLIVFGLIGCAVVMKSLGYNLDMYMTHLHQALRLGDFVTGMIKTIAFGIAIACVGCLHGLKTRMGASAVGYSTTRAVVNSIIMIVVIDGIFAVLFFILGV